MIPHFENVILDFLFKVYMGFGIAWCAIVVFASIVNPTTNEKEE